ncbi:MAG TPA: GNAT family protein [Atribacterota bacterium]|nr:GNAT family protein [Atribacterota bacterium]
MLKGKLVNLRALERKDLEEIMKWVNDREVTKYLSAFLYPVSWAEEEKFLERAMNHYDTEKNLVIETKEIEYIGQISLHKIDWKNRNAELGIVIGDKEYWGKGYGSDAINTLLNHAFNQMNLNKVYLRVFDYNQRGIRCYKKCGFKEEGRLRKGQFYGGKYYDVILMGILKDEFESINQKI